MSWLLHMHEWEKWDVSVVILLTRLLYENSCKLRLYKAKVLIMMMLHVAMLSSYGSIPFRFTPGSWGFFGFKQFSQGRDRSA
jgi:hypothetical protein